MTQGKIYVSRSRSFDFLDTASALSIVKEIEAESINSSWPVMIEVQIKAGTFIVGIGNRSGTVLSYSPSNDPGSSWNSYSNEPTDRILRFEFDGQMTFVPGRAAIEPQQAISAIHFFLEHGKLSTEVSWEEG